MYKVHTNLAGQNAGIRAGHLTKIMTYKITLAVEKILGDE